MRKNGVRQKIGKYEVLGLLGEGGMAAVYKARDTSLDRDVALKVIHQFLQEGERERRRFLNEAKAAAGLTHPNIVTVFELGEDGKVPYIAMEYLPGEDLTHFIHGSGQLTLLQKVEVARQIALGLEHAHSRSVIHRDIKPSNIRLSPSGIVKLMDFGIAKLASENLTKTGQAVGTPSYMSPEQLMGQPIAPASDVFSFGVVVYELLSGRQPFEGRNLQELIGQIVSGEPPALQLEGALAEQMAALVSRCLAKQPSVRFQGFTEVAAELKRIQRLAGDDASGSLKFEPPVERVATGASSGSSAGGSKPVQSRQKTPLQDFTQSGEIRTPAGDNLIPALPAEAFQNRVPAASTTQGAETRLSPLFILGLVLLAVILAGIFLL